MRIKIDTDEVPLEDMKEAVKQYFQKYMLTNPPNVNFTVFYGRRIDDLLRHIADNSYFDRAGEEFKAGTDHAIRMMFNNVLPYEHTSKFPKSNVEERLLALVLTHHGAALIPRTFFKEEVKLKHIISFFQKDDGIRKWKADFFLKVKRKSEVVRDFLLTGNKHYVFAK